MAVGWPPTAATKIAKMAGAIAIEVDPALRLRGRNERWAEMHILQIVLPPGQLAPPQSAPAIPAMHGISTVMVTE